MIIHSRLKKFVGANLGRQRISKSITSLLVLIFLQPMQPVVPISSAFAATTGSNNCLTTVTNNAGIAVTDYTSTIGYCLLKFTTSGTITMTAPSRISDVTLLVVGGGGGGGYNAGEGGGGGAIIYGEARAVGVQSFEITVGAGGNGGANSSGNYSGKSGNSSAVVSNDGTIDVRAGGGGGSSLRSFLLAYLPRFRTIMTFVKSAIFALKPPNYLASALTLLFIIVVVRGDCRPRVLLMNSILALILLVATTLGKHEFFGKPPRGALLALGSLIIATLIWIRLYTSPVLECVENRDLSEVLFGSVAVGLTLLISGVFNQFVSETGIKEDELDIEIALVQSDIARLDNQVIQMRQKSAAVLHGPVLGRLSSIALALKDFSDRQGGQGIEELEAMKSKLLPLIASSQAELANILDSREYLRRPVRVEIDEVVQYWQGLIKVTYKIPGKKQ